MGIADAFGREDRMEVKVASFVEMTQAAAEAEVMSKTSDERSELRSAVQVHPGNYDRGFGSAYSGSGTGRGNN